MKIYIFSLLVLVCLSCERLSDDEHCYIDPSQYDLIIKSGRLCGWCGGQDSLIVTYDQTNYGWNDPCGDNDIFISEPTDSILFTELIDVLNFDAFRAINVNSCNVCADGCDDWIEITMDENTHYIQYGYSDSSLVKPIKPLIDKLTSLRSVYNPQPD